MKYFIALALFVCSCASPSYMVQKNIKVFDQQADTTMTQEQAAKLFDTTFRHRAWREALEIGGVKFEGTWNGSKQWNMFHKALEKWDVVFTSAWVGVELGDGKIAIADGMSDTKGKVLYLKVRPCYGDSALSHELGHILFDSMGIDPDQGHTKEEFWFVLDFMGRDIANNLCPAGYKRTDTPPKKIVR